MVATTHQGFLASLLALLLLGATMGFRPARLVSSPAKFKHGSLNPYYPVHKTLTHGPFRSPFGSKRNMRLSASKKNSPRVSYPAIDWESDPAYAPTEQQVIAEGNVKAILKKRSSSFNGSIYGAELETALTWLFEVAWARADINKANLHGAFTVTGSPNFTGEWRVLTPNLNSGLGIHPKAASGVYKRTTQSKTEEGASITETRANIKTLTWGLFEDSRDFGERDGAILKSTTLEIKPKFARSVQGTIGSSRDSEGRMKLYNTWDLIYELEVPVNTVEDIQNSDESEEDEDPKKTLHCTYKHLGYVVDEENFPSSTREDDRIDRSREVEIAGIGGKLFPSLPAVLTPNIKPGPVAAVAAATTKFHEAIAENTELFGAVFGHDPNELKRTPIFPPGVDVVPNPFKEVLYISRDLLVFQNSGLDGEEQMPTVAERIRDSDED